MPTLKAGKSMRCNNLKIENRRSFERTEGFTLVEVLIALAVVSISLLALLRLQLTSIRMTLSAEQKAQAVLIADEKTADILSGCNGTDGYAGVVEINGVGFRWQSKITDVQSPLITRTNISGLKKAVVSVSWMQGKTEKDVRMTSYIADERLQ